MAKQKKPKTIKQQANKYRNIKIGCIGAEFLSAIAPLVTIALINKDKYFVDFEGTKISIGMFMAMAFMGFSIWAISKKKLENTMISLIIKLSIWAFVVTMIESILHDLAMILWMTVIGLAVAQGFEWGSEKAAKEQKKKLDAIAKAKEKHDVEQAEHELDPKDYEIDNEKYKTDDSKY